MHPERSTTSVSRPGGPDRSRRGRRIVLLVNGIFLTTVGALQVTLELLAYFAGRGPFSAIFGHSPYAIGWVENHGLALLVGILLLTVARDGRRSWHRFAIAVHVLLGGANLVFWSSFVTFHTELLGAAATTVHVLLVLAHACCLVISRSPGRSAALQPVSELIGSGR